MLSSAAAMSTKFGVQELLGNTTILRPWFFAVTTMASLGNRISLFLP